MKYKKILFYFFFGIFIFFWIPQMAAQDVGVIALLAPVDPMCPDSSQTVAVTIQNFGASSINLSVDSITVNVDISGAMSENYNLVLNTGTFVPGEKRNIVLTNSADLSVNGVYIFGAYTLFSADSDPFNDSIAPVSITVEDITAPIPDVINLPDIVAECNVTVSVIPTATDNCKGTVNGTTDDTLYYDEQGTYLITWTYDDGNGNTITQSQSVIISDTTAPVADSVILPDVTAQCSIVLSSPTATDNCEGMIVATTTDPVNYAGEGIYLVTWIYEDSNGNSTTQTQQVIIDDTIVPVSDSTGLPDLIDVCSVTVMTTPTATDSCVGAVSGITADPLFYDVPGTYIITWSYDDGNGNSSSQTQKVIVTAVDTSVTQNGVTLSANNSSSGVNYQWIDCNGNVAVPGEMNQVFPPQSDGSYAVVVTENGCTDTSSCYTMVITGNNNSISNAPAYIYPGSFPGIVMIDLKAEMKSRINVWNVLGEEILNKEMESQQMLIDLSNQKDGMFLISVETQGQKQIFKWIKY